jgi:hypothetical protein
MSEWYRLTFVRLSTITYLKRVCQSLTLHRRSHLDDNLRNLLNHGIHQSPRECRQFANTDDRSPRMEADGERDRYIATGQRGACGEGDDIGDAAGGYQQGRTAQGRMCESCNLAYDYSLMMIWTLAD